MVLGGIDPVGSTTGIGKSTVLLRAVVVDGKGAEEFSVAPDLDGVLDDGHFDLATPVGVADSIGRRGEADGAVLVDLAGDDGVGARSRRRRGESLALDGLVELSGMTPAWVATSTASKKISTRPSRQTTSTFCPAK